MATFSYRSAGAKFDLQLKSLAEVNVAQQAAPQLFSATSGRTRLSPEKFLPTLAQSAYLKQRIYTDNPKDVLIARRLTVGPQSPAAIAPATTMIVTRTLIVEGARRADLQAAHDAGAHVVHEGLDGKILLDCETVENVFAVADLLIARDVGAAVPNFLRRIDRAPLSVADAAWAHAKINVAGAWAITKGDKSVKVAVLDEGVDTTHKALKETVVAEKDFIGTNGDSAMPSGNDAHGTACAGIVLSGNAQYPGIAPHCSLIAARIAMGDGTGAWIFDDYAAADAIDWCWRNGADVLSNSWGGGLPSDAIIRAFGRARTQGRGGKGAVVIIAAGNAQEPIDFPGNLPGYTTVGASTPKDEWKSRHSSDREPWGSNYGPTLWILAPGVRIWTTDIKGPPGYEVGDYTRTFNGTSSATPHVAGAAALMLSINPDLLVSEVREILKATADFVPNQTDWTDKEGWGRLNVGNAVRAAQSKLSPPSPGGGGNGGSGAPSPSTPKARKSSATRKPGSVTKKKSPATKKTRRAPKTKGKRSERK